MIAREGVVGPPPETLNPVFRALADPTRRAILARLARCDATVGELAEPFPMTLQAVSRHLAVLERAGLVVRGREAQWRTSSLDPRPLRDAAAWLDGFRSFWDLDTPRG
ncbi:metalloregulator ArsR/SmtB family transcription factor [Actinotalea sp.]|uniref:ArsR/SmtB family transcription factor n=1 Tax=Actinotalea sp. TaxID=1872145 RepID=UPI002C90B56E|nr:metalloregulator ArsR/SmtB family transcription factor [Actinotalea sp.]HQY33398.1 metalloregulator ArsR/SmtB family transcription factor [Actinotalea sp.]HRA51154.1 metalloregulator ArsR/SmtB family transcription factor [Actinotalea sp.]